MRALRVKATLHTLQTCCDTTEHHVGQLMIEVLMEASGNLKVHALVDGLAAHGTIWNGTR